MLSWPLPNPKDRRTPPPAKLSPPRLAAVLARPRLFKLLDRAARRPVIWIEGPAGSGKTTLAASWLARRPGRTLWLQVDERDRDPATFFYFLREGVRRLAPRRRETLPLLTPEYLQGLGTYSRNFFDGAFERLGARAVLVLDDFQELPQGAPLHRLLPDALGGIPQGIHVLVLSRTAPPPELSRLRANSLVATIGWDELRFTEREAAGLLAEHGVPCPGPDALARLHHDTDGWAAGLVLLGEAARGLESPAAREEGRTPAELIEYFASELFDRAEPPVQRFLLATSILATVTPAVADRLGGAGAGQHLERLARCNFFTSRRTGSGAVYQYHPLFRAFLRARAESALAPAERADARRRAATVLEEAGQTEEALALLLEAGDGSTACTLIRRLALALEQQGRLQTLEAWIRTLPAADRESDPWMLQWLGACRVFSDPSESLALHERAFAAFQARGDDAGSLAAWTGAVDAIFLGWHDFAKLDPWLRWLDERMRTKPEFPSPELEARVTASMVSRLVWRQPSHPDIAAWHDRLARLVRQTDDPDLQARGLLNLAWYRAWVGDPPAVASALEALERACQAPGVPAATRIAALHAVSNASHYATEDSARALARNAEALRLAEATGIHAFDAMLHSVAASLLLSRRDLAAADRLLDIMRASPGATPYYQLSAWRAHLLGDLDEAVALAERALETFRATGITLVHTLIHYQLAQHHRARGDRTAAARHLTVAEETAAAGHSAIHGWACKLARAQLALDAGDRAACRTGLAEALAEGRERGFTNVPWWSTALALSGLCEEALDADIEPQYVRKLIRIHDLVPDPARPGAERWPFPLKVHALGPFVLERGDLAAPPTVAGRKPLELLKALVALGGRGVPEAAVIELLWPDAEGDRGRQRLKFTLHSLRRELGPDEVLSLEKGLLTLDPRRVWVDIWELDRQLARLAAAVERSHHDEAASALACALAIPRGPLLDADPAPWALAARERLGARLLRLVTRSVELLGGRDPAEAIPHLERAQELFPSDDRLRQALLRARGASR